MPFSINVLNIILLASSVTIPALYYSTRHINIWYTDETRISIVRYWLYFLILIVSLRTLVGLGFLVTGNELYGIAKFYPIRIAYPNYEFLHGIPYMVLCIAIFFSIHRIGLYISKSNWRYPLMWCFSVILLLAFGGIHGGLVTGNLGISSSVAHLADASINMTVTDTLVTHVDRIVGNVTPAYQAPHSMSHPVGSIIYWQIITKYLPPFMLSVINVMLFSLVFPVILWALRKRLNKMVALQGTLICLMLPAMLIYGRSDDAIFYAFAGIIISLTYVAISEKRYGLTIIVALLLFSALNYTYAALIMLPAMYSFNSDVRLSEVFEYIRLILPHIVISVSIIALSIFILSEVTSFSLLDSFRASVKHNAGSNIVALLDLGKYGRVINDRIMAISDFLIFGGPVFLYLLVQWFRNWNSHITNWHLKNIALFVLLFVLIVNSNGPGEVSRPWGGIYLLIAFCWITKFLRKETEETRWWVIRVQFAWALTLQIPLNYGW